MFAWDEVCASIELYNSFGGVGMSDATLFEEIRQHEMLLQAAIGNAEFWNQNAKWLGAQVVYIRRNKFFMMRWLQKRLATQLHRKRICSGLLNDSFFDLGVTTSGWCCVRNRPINCKAYSPGGSLQINPHSTDCWRPMLRRPRDWNLMSLWKTDCWHYRKYCLKLLYQNSFHLCNFLNYQHEEFIYRDVHLWGRFWHTVKAQDILVGGGFDLVKPITRQALLVKCNLALKAIALFVRRFSVGGRWTTGRSTATTL